MLTYKRRVPEINTDDDLNDGTKYANYTTFKGIVESDNIFTVDQESLADAKNVYVDEEGHLVSRPTVQAVVDSNNIPTIIYSYIYAAKTYNLIDVIKFGKWSVYVLKSHKNDTYTIIPIEDGESLTYDNIGNRPLEDIVNYSISCIENYIICFTTAKKTDTKLSYIGAQVFDISNSTTVSKEWNSLNDYCEIPVVKRIVGTQVTTYDKNQFTNYTKEEYVWSNSSMPLLPESTSDTIKVINNNSTTYWKVQDDDKNLSVNSDYRLLAKLPVDILSTDIVTIAQSVICIARSSYFLLSFNNGQSFTQYYYPAYSGKFLNICSVSQDSKYFLFVTTEGVYECNIVDIGSTSAFTWKLYYLDGDDSKKIGDNLKETDYSILANCLSYPTGNNFAFMLNSNGTQDLSTYGRYDSYIYYCGKELYLENTTNDELILHRTNLPATKKVETKDSSGNITNTAYYPVFDVPLELDITNCINMSLDSNGVPLIVFTALWWPLEPISVTTVTKDEEHYGGKYRVIWDDIINDSTVIKKFDYYNAAEIYNSSSTSTSDLNNRIWITTIQGGTYKLADGTYNTNYRCDRLSNDLTINDIITSKPTGYNGIYDLKIISLKTDVDIDKSSNYLFTETFDVFIRYKSNNNQVPFWNIGKINIYCDTYNTNSFIEVLITDNTTFSDTIFTPVYNKGEPYKLGGGYLVLNDSINTVYSYEYISNQWTKNLLQLKDKSSGEIIPFSFNSVKIVSDKFYLFNNDSESRISIYTNNFTDTDSAIIDYIIEPTGDDTNKYYLQVPRCSYVSTELYLGINNKLYITNNTRDENNKLLLNLPPINNHSFVGDISNISNISTTETAIFLEDSIKICTKVEDDTYGYRYDYYNTKLSVGVNFRDSVINTNEGTYTLFPTRRGLAAMNYQAFMSTTDQTLTYITSNIADIWKDFYNQKPVDNNIDGLGTYNRFVKITQYKQYLILTNGTKVVLIYDLTRSYWWVWELPEPILKMVTNQEYLRAISMKYSATIFIKDTLWEFDIPGRLLELTNEIDGKTAIYRDFSKLKGLSTFPSNIPIDWYIVSQPLHFNAITYYKNIKQLIFHLYDTDNLDNETLKSQSIKAQIQIFRKRLDIRRPETIDFKIDNLRTFVKRFNYWKINELQWGLSADIQYTTKNVNGQMIEVDTTDNPQPLKLNGLSIKYEIGEEVR